MKSQIVMESLVISRKHGLKCCPISDMYSWCQCSSCNCENTDIADTTERKRPIMSDIVDCISRNLWPNTKFLSLVWKDLVMDTILKGREKRMLRIYLHV